MIVFSFSSDTDAEGSAKVFVAFLVWRGMSVKGRGSDISLTGDSAVCVCQQLGRHLFE